MTKRPSATKAGRARRGRHAPPLDARLTAIVVSDAQPRFLERFADTQSNLDRLLLAASAVGVLIAFSHCHMDYGGAATGGDAADSDAAARDAAARDAYSALLPRYRNYVDNGGVLASAFSARGRGPADIVSELRARGIRLALIAGVATDLCPDLQALELRQRGIATTLIRDAAANATLAASELPVVADRVWTVATALIELARIVPIA